MGAEVSVLQNDFSIGPSSSDYFEPVEIRPSFEVAIVARLLSERIDVVRISPEAIPNPLNFAKERIDSC